MPAKSLALPVEERIFPVAVISGNALVMKYHKFWEQRNPSNWKEKIGRVPLASQQEVDKASRAASAAQQKWEESSIPERRLVLLTFASVLLRASEDLARTMALEIGKPLTLGEAEVRFAADLLRATARLIGAQTQDSISEVSFRVRRRAGGVVGILTPWNNPVAIPVGKLAPAIEYGNGVVWKAALQAPRSSLIIYDALCEAGCPKELVSLLFGDKDTAVAMILEPRIRAVSLTGSGRAGRRVAGLAARRLKPVQLELGGNNAVIVMPDTDLERAAGELAESAFSFSGQRCTAPRRFIVHKKVWKRFEEVLVGSVQALRLGLPLSPATQVGPLISKRKQTAMGRLVKKSLAAGVRILCGGKIPDSWKEGCWFEPTIVFSPTQASPSVQEESFGPVVVLQVARDIIQAVELLNGVPQGLVASLYSEDRACQEYFLRKAECGVLKLNQTTLGVSPDAPFGGWKDSGWGPVKHGIWDREFYTRLQTVYG
ncbi:MAG: aldehyde dehydrogenase family protein [Acidobacteriota bacterium]